MTKAVIFIKCSPYFKYIFIIYLLSIYHCTIIKEIDNTNTLFDVKIFNNRYAMDYIYNLFYWDII